MAPFGCLVVGAIGAKQLLMIVADSHSALATPCVSKVIPPLSYDTLRAVWTEWSLVYLLRATRSPSVDLVLLRSGPALSRHFGRPSAIRPRIRRSRSDDGDITVRRCVILAWRRRCCFSESKSSRRVSVHLVSAKVSESRRPFLTYICRPQLWDALTCLQLLMQQISATVGVAHAPTATFPLVAL